MNEQIELLDKELNNIKIGERILKSKKEMLEQERANLIQNPDVLLEIQRDEFAEEQDIGQEQDNIDRKRGQELSAFGEEIVAVSTGKVR